MSATPIPRTLALAVYGDLDLSLLDEIPASRKPVITHIIEPGKREETYAFIRREVKRGRQVFVICPRIEVGDETKMNGQRQLLFAEVKAATAEYKKLSEDIFPDLKVAMLHGRMKPKEKESVMKKFRNRESDILVSTSVVEVGVDLPNATIILIEGAERFGLAQLHQFRGRVGRGEEQSYCFLFPTTGGGEARRLRALVSSKNGFELAEQDLTMRGAGELFGTKQWGISTIDPTLLSNAALIRIVRDEVALLLSESPDLKKFPHLREGLIAFAKALHLE